MLDETDKKILALLMRSPEITQKQIAGKVGLTAPAINNRLQRLRADGVLLGSSLLIDLGKLGYDITVLVNAKIRNGKLVEASEKYSKEPGVCSTYTVTGEYDMVLVAKFHNTKELEKWNQKMTQDTEFIERINTSLVFTMQKEGTNPNGMA